MRALKECSLTDVLTYLPTYLPTHAQALKEWQKLSRKGGADRLLAGLRGLSDSLSLPSPKQIKPPRLPSLPKLPQLRLGHLKQDATSHVASVRSALGGRRASLPHRAPTTVV